HLGVGVDVAVHAVVLDQPRDRQRVLAVAAHAPNYSLRRARNPDSAELNSLGWSIGPRWPQPCSRTNSAPGIFAAIFCMIFAGAVASSLPAISRAGTAIFGSSARRSKVVS